MGLSCTTDNMPVKHAVGGQVVCNSVVLWVQLIYDRYDVLRGSPSRIGPHTDLGGWKDQRFRGWV